MNSISNNAMAVNVADNLSGHYGRLKTSVQRLSTGLRINSAADDAAGLAIRELMRADVAALNQGVRNANDAISMLQVADAALAIIDEKLIRMKELAEQAATGTYDSTQRLLIDSEYKAMAAEIDRIARATDFNGIKLLDGSLSGAHDGRGLQSTGKMKIHFGVANDSAEDYYYVEIGACTTEALGLGSSGTGSADTIEYTKVETWGVGQVKLAAKEYYDQYVDPDTNQTYLTDGNIWFTDVKDPASSKLDWQKDGEIIKKLRPTHAYLTSITGSTMYVDETTGKTYYSIDKSTFSPDPYDSSVALDATDPEDKKILDRLKVTQNWIQVTCKWYRYKDPAGKEYYSYNGGETFVPDCLKPAVGILRKGNPQDKKIIDSLEYVPLVAGPGEQKLTYNYDVYVDKTTSQEYYSQDGGKTFLTNRRDPDGSQLDPVKDKNIIMNLEPKAETAKKGIAYDIYLWDDDPNKRYYTKDNGKTFIKDLTKPDQIAFRDDNPADAAFIGHLVPSIKKTAASIRYNVYEDPTNNSKQYFTKDNGKTFISDLADPAGSSFSASDPAYAGLVANLVSVGSTTNVNTRFANYLDPNTNKRYYSDDGGKSFFADTTNPQGSLLDPSQPGIQDLIDRLTPECNTSSVYVEVKVYQGSGTLKIYEHPEKDGRYINDLGTVVLDSSNPAHISIINNLQELQEKSSVTIVRPMPPEFDVFIYPPTGEHYYVSTDGSIVTRRPDAPYDDRYRLDKNDPQQKPIIDGLQAVEAYGRTITYVPHRVPGVASGGGGMATISTQQAAQEALVAIDRAIVSKDQIRAHLGALQNRLENTVANLTIQSENLQAAESRISDVDVAREMTEFVRNQVLAQSAVAMLGQANSYPHILAGLING